jgi:hypothetical protein
MYVWYTGTQSGTGGEKRETSKTRLNLQGLKKNLRVCTPRTLLYDPCVPVSVYSICDRHVLPRSLSRGPADSSSQISIPASLVQFGQPSRLGIIASSACFCGF